MSEPTHYNSGEGGDWTPWDGGIVDGRALKKRNSKSVVINGVTVHALKLDDGREWDCINGVRPVLPWMNQQNIVAESGLQQFVPAPVVANSEAQTYAARVWGGQTAGLPREERLRRVKLALDGQGLSMEGVTL